MTVKLKKASCGLEQMLFDSVEDKTPQYVKDLDLIDLSNKNEFVFKLKREYLEPYDEAKNPQGLGLWDWFKNYEKEAKVSTAGIRGPQNILYPQDTRFPINLIGITLATVAKALVANEKNYKRPTKLVGREVRYNSDLFLDAIARIQAAYGIKTLVPVDKETIPIWLASFLVFKLGLIGGEYITSSHGISVKNATKDLNSQGGQYLPEESMEFVNKIREIFEIAQREGSYDIKFSAVDDCNIDQNTMRVLDNGIQLYIDYLRTGVARDINLNLIKEFKSKIVIENVGGSAYKTLSKILSTLDISNKFEWLDEKEDPFFNAIGKYGVDPKGNKAFYDYSVDATVMKKRDDGSTSFPVIETMQYDKRLAKYPINTVVLITDPDHDRLTVSQIESSEKIEELKKAGIDFVKLSDDRILTVFTANQAFLMLMNFRIKQLEKLPTQSNPMFMIKTTASSLAWDEWAEKNNIKVVNVPVGFKEIANIMKKVEAKIKKFQNDDVIITDVLGKKLNLGKNPRLLFAGEESGGMIMGPPTLISSESGLEAIAMREKSATEAIIVASSLTAKLELENKSLSQYFTEVIETNDIKGRFDTRADIAYYNESEPDIKKLNEAKKIGEAKRTQNDLYYLSLAIGVMNNELSLENVKEILNNTFPQLDFSNLKEITFVGDGTYLKFDDKFIEIRPSGTDAKTKAYGAGLDKSKLEQYTSLMGNYSGERLDFYNKFVSDKLYNSAKEQAMEAYLKFVNSDLV